jgi:dCTP deaminase
MILPDHEISALAQGQRLISPYFDHQQQPASYDVLLDRGFMLPDRESSVEKPADAKVKIYPDDEVWLLSGDLVLASTLERVEIPNDLVGRIEGKSSLARVGIQIHSAGYLDPGFCGNVTLEIVNFWPTAVRLWAGMPIAQLSFEQLSSRCHRPYGSPGLNSHYQNAVGVGASQYGTMGT